MASYEDFEPDSDEEYYLKDIVAMPLGYNPESSPICVTQQVETVVSSSAPSDESKKLNKPLETLTISSDPLLKDHEREQLAVDIKALWLAYGNEFYNILINTNLCLETHLSHFFSSLIFRQAR